MRKTESIFAIAILTVLFVVALILCIAVFNKYVKVPNYSKAICNMNDEKIEIKINKIKVIDDKEYLITSDNDEKWLVSSYYCTFVEE